MSEQENIEQDFIQVDEWISRIDKDGIVGKIEGGILDRTLNSLGAEMEITEDEEKSLGKYQLGPALKGMEAVWGPKKLHEFDVWRVNWIKDYENIDGNRRLPKMPKTGRVGAGMSDFFHQFTAFAYGVMHDEDFVRYTEARVINGKLWQENKDDQRVKVTTPLSKEIRIGELPPGFVKAFWEWLKS